MYAGATLYMVGMLLLLDAQMRALSKFFTVAPICSKWLDILEMWAKMSNQRSTGCQETLHLMRVTRFKREEFARFL